MIAGFWAFVVIWDGQIVLWETLGFLLLYVLYILVVVLGRYVNQRIKVATHGAGALLKNDFSCNSVNVNGPRSGGASTSNAGLIGNEAYDRDRADTEYEENEALRRPLLGRKSSRDSQTLSDNASESHYQVVSLKMAIIDTFLPIDLVEWKESNILFKFMIIVKVCLSFLTHFLIVSSVQYVSLHK
jgi:hypothetical protein